MILGVGLDLCQVFRIERSLKRLGDDWIDELFTVDKRKLCERGMDPILLFACGFCGKEACFKALGTGRTAGIDWHDIEILQTGSSASLQLSGGALQELQGLTPASYEPVLHVACFGGAGIAQAIVTISAIPQRQSLLFDRKTARSEVYRDGSSSSIDLKGSDVTRLHRQRQLWFRVVDMLQRR
jgi:holo-[acyl-carrier protein] synthase